MLDHGLRFFIEGAEITVDEMGDWVASRVASCHSEHDQELLAHDITHGIINCVIRKVNMAKADSDRAGWMKRNPPNHAGFYYCHLCGGWVHHTEAELDHIDPRSVAFGSRRNADDNRRMSHTWPVIAPDGKEVCPGNRGKGSRILPSATMEVAPPDMEL